MSSIEGQRKRYGPKAAFGPKNMDFGAIHEPINWPSAKALSAVLENQALRKSWQTLPSTRPTWWTMRFDAVAVPIRCDGEVIGIIDSEHSARVLGLSSPNHAECREHLRPKNRPEPGRGEGEGTAKFFQLNPNPVARIGKDGEILLANDSAFKAFGPKCKPGGKILPEHPMHPLVSRAMAQDEPFQDRLCVGTGGTVAMARIANKPFLHMYADVTEVQHARARAAQAERHKSISCPS